MKIIFLTVNLAQIGGIERVITILANNLVENYDYNVEIVSVFSNASRNDVKFVLKDKVNTEFLGKKGVDTEGILKRVKYEYIQSKQLIKYIKNSKADICVITHNMFNPFLFLMKKRLKCKLIFCEHSTHKQYSKGRNIVNILTYMGADRLIVLSKKDAEFYEKFIKCVDIIHNPKLLNYKVKAKQKNKKIISVGRLTYIKGFDRLIEAFSLIADNNKEWSLEIVGGGGEEKNLNKKIEEFGLQNRVKILPFTNNIEEHYLDAMVYALPSRDESFGMVLLEAMEMGLPCIAFESFGPEEIIINNQNGILVKNNDLIGFSKEMEKLMQNEELRDKIVYQAFEDIKKYEVNAISKKWNSIFEDFNK